MILSPGDLMIVHVPRDLELYSERFGEWLFECRVQENDIITVFDTHVNTWSSDRVQHVLIMVHGNIMWISNSLEDLAWIKDYEIVQCKTKV